jgi:apolipoprotein N-acyltransferase
VALLCLALLGFDVFGSAWLGLVPLCFVWPDFGLALLGFEWLGLPFVGFALLGFAWLHLALLCFTWLCLFALLGFA